MTILQTIRDSLPTLPPSEKRVALWLLENPRAATNTNIAELASLAGISEPTVIRFCRRLGLNGFRALKDQLIAASQIPETYLHQSVQADDTVSTAALKVMETCTRTLLDLSRLTAVLPFEEATQLLTNARQIVFAGIGASGLVAQDATHKFFRLGTPCTAATDTQTILQMASIATEDDVFIFISQTGKWPELTRAVSLCRAQGAKVIAISGEHTPLGAAANLVFDCKVAEDTNIYTPMNSRLAHLVLLDALQVVLALTNGSDAEAKLRTAKSAIQPVAESPVKRKDK
ncbi:MAG: MurR/RpiR family transcriptional regulator [Pseudomonadales bacterium]|nr:MurR/RpiR family transcriptional regulator [Pseudomonadales bacterium]